MLLRIALALLAGILILVALIGFALRDNPARPAIGEARFVEAEGARIQYFVSGPENGIMVPLLASYARSASDFNELVKDLNAAGYLTLALQARGVDGSELPSLQPSLFDYAGDLAAALDAEAQHGPLCVIGHAYGNRIARAFASRYPERIDSLILLAAGSQGPPPETRDAIMKVLLQIWPDNQRLSALQAAFFAPGNTAPDHWLNGWYPKAALAQTYATANTPPSQWVHGGDAGMFIVQPDHDAAAAEGAAFLQQQFPQRVRVVELNNAGHAILPEQPQKVSELILNELKKCGRSIP